MSKYLWRHPRAGFKGSLTFTEDNDRYYRLCRKCLQDFEQSGLGDKLEIKDFDAV
ncbi:hypothetical protein [Desulfonatronovibrio magnus]|uniref:hypothetical protein n=1 Tax=Desulfonatronovibrio magnus TaxID=698827 RepID=UPI0012F9C76B|nr:hypothetical protein [Desulfonatronovibrio magnus]